jgi:hypothetical protein
MEIFDFLQVWIYVGIFFGVMFITTELLYWYDKKYPETDEEEIHPHCI